MFQHRYPEVLTKKRKKLARLAFFVATFEEKQLTQSNNEDLDDKTDSTLIFIYSL